MSTETTPPRQPGAETVPKKHAGGKFPKGVSGNPGGKKRQPDPIPEPVHPEVAQPGNNGRNADGTFAKGNQFNPDGKAKGTRHRATRLAEALLDGQVEELTQKAVQMALAGDASVMRAILDRLLPPRRERPVDISLPKVAVAKDLIEATAALTQAVATGEITPGEAADLAKLVESTARAIEVSDIAERLQAVEALLAAKS